MNRRQMVINDMQGWVQSQCMVRIEDTLWLCALRNLNAALDVAFEAAATADEPRQ